MTAPDSESSETGNPDETGDGDPDASDDADENGTVARLDATLKRARTDPRAHPLAFVVCLLLGLGLAWLHWLGLVLGGVLVGLVSPTLGRAVVSAVGFGVVVLVVFALTLGETTTHVLGMTPAVYLTVASAIALPLVGSLVRAVG